jgi:ATP-dependent Clp protease ATP-binding subunit ClpB
LTKIEKASNSLWQLLLAILDKATLTLGDNTRVDFSQTIVFMTSNLGAREISELISGPMGFAPGGAAKIGADELDQKIYRTAVEAARRKFSPEFMNRIDKVAFFLDRCEASHAAAALDSVHRRLAIGATNHRAA